MQKIYKKAKAEVSHDKDKKYIVAKKGNAASIIYPHYHNYKMQNHLGS